MSMQIGIVGKPNVGKSTFFNAATDAHAEIANYPFTTIDANRGVMYVRKPCPCKEFNVICTPHNSKCINGTRFVPIEAIDVAGLVPDAYKGRGLGNKFLDDLSQADALIHIVDASGSTDAEGNPCGLGKYDPLHDVDFLEKEITYWFKNIISKDWQKFDIGWAKVLLDGCLDFAFGDIWIGTLNGAYKFSKKDSFVLCIKFCIQHYKTIIFFEDKHIYILKIRLIS